MKLDNRTPLAPLALASLVAEVFSLQLVIQDAYTYGTVSIGIGSPATNYDVIVSTGSANTWVGAGMAYVETSSSVDTGNTVSVNEDSASFSGEEYTDNLDLAGTTFEQSIGVARRSSGYADVDGVLGLGPVGLTVGTLSNRHEEIPTVSDNLFSKGLIDSDSVTIGPGSITFGPPAVSVADFIYVPLSNSDSASAFWGIDAGFTYGDNPLLATSPGIIDHSTSLLHLAENAYQDFLRLTGATVDEDTGLPMLSSCNGLSPITLKLGEESIDIPVGQYRFPAEAYTEIGGREGVCYLGVGSTEGLIEDGVGFLIGWNTLKHLTVFLDKENSRVGIANVAVEA